MFLLSQRKIIILKLGYDEIDGKMSMKIFH